MSTFSALASCEDITTALAREAASSSASLRELLRRAAEIASPGPGCARIVHVLAQVHGRPWLDGPLRVELAGGAGTTTLEVYCDIGGPFLERITPPVIFRVPLEAFSSAIAVAPDVVLPLRIEAEGNKLVFMSPLAPESLPPPSDPIPVELEEPPAAAPVASASPPARVSLVPLLYEDFIEDDKSTVVASGEAAQHALLSNMDAVPRLVAPQTPWLSIDARAPLVVACIDGVTSVSGIVELCSLEEDEVLRVLSRLVVAGVVGLT